MNNDTPEQKQAKRESFGYIEGLKGTNRQHEGQSVAAQVHYEATHRYELMQEKKIDEGDLW